MSRIFEGQLNSQGLKIGFVCSRFNDFIVSKLYAGAMDCFIRHGGEASDTATLWVPGSFEIPLAAKKLAETKNFDAIVCLGAVIRGSTPHFDLVANEVAKGIAHVALATGIPVSFGVLTTDSIEQAIERAGTKAGNKGFEACLGAIETANVFKQLAK